MSSPPISEEEMLRSFEYFMLSGGEGSGAKIGSRKKKGRKNKSGHEDFVTLSPRQTDIEASRRGFINAYAKLGKQSWRDFNNFCDMVRSRWILIDDHSEEVVSSIENIQMRIPKEMKQLSNLKIASDRIAPPLHAHQNGLPEER